MTILSSVSSYSDSSYSEELKRIYKQQLKLKNENLKIKARIDKNLKFDAINNTNIRQRHIDNLIETINQNNNKLEALDNKLVYIEQVMRFENDIAYENRDH
ncbi:MAG: hypothetical protein HND53_12135 [Proteobacteria bacterium]|nr:hypothetical protein [Pseudomonadota bacterium]NOG61243.1 hypothetical protein [Pseudomonadota bacterium]